MAYQSRDYRRAAVEFDDPRTAPRSPAPSRRGREEFDVDVRVRERERDTDGLDFVRRRQEAGPIVLRQREVDNFDHHARDHSPARYRDDRGMRRPKSVSPPHEHEHERTRVVERDTFRSPSIVRRRSPSRHRSPSRRRSPSPRNVRYVGPAENEHIHTRIVETERERVPSPSPSPPPAPPVIRGPRIEREVITHYRDIDHGMIQARPRSPPAPVRRREQETRETDIDISLSRGRAEVDIHRSASRTRSKSRERRSSRFYEDDLVIQRDLKIEEPLVRRRAHSVGAQDDDAEYITSRLDSRGHMGEAHGGATKDWCIVDVPPGTERIRMEGIGGAGTETTFSKYRGVRRTTFIPDRSDREGSVIEAPTPPPASGRKDHHLNISVHDRERQIEIEKISDRRVSRSPAPPPAKDMWTEITKDLVVREAIEELGYEYEETEYFFYVMEYLRYDDVLQLTELSDDIRRSRRQRTREVRYDREHWDDADRRYYDAPAPRRSQPPPHRRDEGHERIRETEVIYDSRGPARSYR